MDIWQVLGIEKTKDKNSIKQAYRKRLQSVNPEDDAEGFMELRAAFEQANKLADMEEEPAATEELSPLEQAIDDLYQDFGRRIDVEAWQELLDMDEFVALDTSMDSFVTLITYLMKHYYLPKSVWQYIVEHFDIKGRKREYAEQFPSDFLDYMINNSIYDDLISYDLFSGDVSKYDSYLENFYRLDAAIRKKNYEEQAKYFEVLDNMDVSHPYLDVAHIRAQIQVMKDQAEEKNENVATLFADRFEMLEKTAHRLNEVYEDEMVILHICGDLALIKEDYENAKLYYDRTIELSKDNYIAKGKQAELALCMGEYTKARDLYLALLRINHYDNHVRAGMMRANMELIESYKKKLEENPDDSDTKIEMAWSNYQNYRFEEAIDSIKGVTPEGKQVFEFHNVRGRSYLCLAEYDKAIDDFFYWKEAIAALPEEDNSEETEKLRKRLPYVNFLIADCYLKTKQYDKARKYLDYALAHEHDEIVLSYEARCEIEYKTENYEACIDACNVLLEKDDRSFIGYMFMARADFELEYYKDALVSCEHAIALYPYVAEPYSLEAQIYLKAGYRELAEQTLDRFRAYEIESDELDFCTASILELDNKHEEIVSLLQSTVARADDVASDKEDYEEIRMMLGFHLEKLERYEEALEQYKIVYEKFPDHDVVNGRIGLIHKNMGNYEEALTYIKRQLELHKHPLFYIEQGMIMQYLGDDQGAFESFQTVLKYDSKNTFCLTRVGLIYEEKGKFKEALAYYRKAYDNTSEERIKDKKTLHTSIARVLQCTLQFLESKKEYIEYINTYGAEPDIVYDYAELLMRTNHADEALALLKECIQKKHDDSSLIQMCARQYISICGSEGKLQQAEEMLEYLLSEKYEIDARTYFVLGRAYFDNRHISDAISNYEKAVALDKENKQNYYSDLMEAICSKHFVRPKNTEILFKKALEVLTVLKNPNDCVKASTVYRCKGQKEDALKFVDKGLRIKRCMGCFYSKCHEALYEKALIYESRRDYQLARMCLIEAIKICGHNTLYEKHLKRIKDK